MYGFYFIQQNFRPNILHFFYFKHTLYILRLELACGTAMVTGLPGLGNAITRLW